MAEEVEERERKQLILVLVFGRRKCHGASKPLAPLMVKGEKGQDKDIQGRGVDDNKR